MSTAWPMTGPQPRDELAAWSDARLSSADFPEPVPMAAPAPPGAFEVVDGRGVYVRRVAGPDDAVPTWYIHGLAGSSTNWTRLAGVLASRSPGFLVDLPGSGRSDPPPRGRYSLTGDADLVAALITDLCDGPVHICGNSLGGVVATALAARHPELVRTLTLISPAVPDLRLGQDRGADPRLALLLMPGTGQLARRRLAAIDPLDRARGMGAICFGDPAALSDEDYRVASLDLAWRTGLPWAQMATISSLRALMRSYLRPGRWSFATAARTVAAPTLVVWGTRDKLVDVRLARRTTDLFRNGRLLVVPGSGHVVQMEHPAQTARAVAALWEDTRAGTDDPARAPGAPLPNGAVAVATSTA